MAVNYAYNFAEIDDATGMCVGVLTTTNPETEGPSGSGSTYIPIPTDDDNYLLKYYSFDTGKWYYDAEMTQEYIPA
jgi:hypothetical protein